MQLRRRTRAIAVPQVRAALARRRELQAIFALVSRRKRSVTDLLDVAIVGAGAAGIAAARRLIGLGRSVLLVEALPRLGGRALTVQVAGLPLDLGCGWLHSADRNPLAALADTAGIELDRSKAAWGEQLRDVGATAGTQEQAWDAYEAFGTRLRRDPPASDRAGDAMSPGDPWRPFVDALSGFMNGAENRPALGRRLPRLRRRGQRDQLAASRRLRRLHCQPRRRPARRSRNPRHRDLGGAAHPARHRSRTDRGAGGDRRGLDRGAGQRRDPLRSAGRRSSPRRFAPAARPRRQDLPFARRAGRGPAGEPPARPLRQRPHRQLLPAALRPPGRRMLPRRRPRPRTRGRGRGCRRRLRHRRASRACSAPTSPAASRRSRSLPGAGSRRSSAPTATPSPDRPTPAPSWPDR